MDYKRNAVIRLYQCKKRPCEILKALKDFEINRQFIYRTIKRFNETGSVKKRVSGGKSPSATCPDMVRKVKAQIARNPRRSSNQIAKKLKISDRSVRRILKDKLKLKPYKIQKIHELAPKQMKVRLERAKLLKRLHERGELPNIVFSDEKISLLNSSLISKTIGFGCRGDQRIIRKKF